MAAAFEETSLEEKPALVDLLTKKAEEYRALESEVNAIDDGLKRLSNLMATTTSGLTRSPPVNTIGGKPSTHRRDTDRMPT